METAQTTIGFDEVEGHRNDVVFHAQRPDRCRRWNIAVKRRMKISAAATRHHHIHIPGNYFGSSKARGQKLMSTPPLMLVMEYMVPSVLALVTLKYQAKTGSPFLENPAPVWCFFAATCVYWLIVGAMKQIITITQKCFQAFSNAALASAVLSTLSLVSIFMPYAVSLVPLLIWIPLPLVLAWPILYQAYSLLRRGIKAVINKMQLAILVWAARGVDSTEEASTNRNGNLSAV